MVRLLNRKLHLGDARVMPDVADASTALVVTSPPYFCPEIGQKLAVPRLQQTNFEDIERQVLAFALSLRPVFSEIKRILRPDGVLVLQSKDLRYGEWLIALSDTHSTMALQAGLHLIGRVSWAPIRMHPKRLPGFVRAPRVGTYRPLEVEWFMVFGNEEGRRPGSRLTPTDDYASLVAPFWRTQHDQRRHRHPYGSPPSAVRRWIELYTEPGDLVVDPFAGYGTTVEEAIKMGREAVGYDNDPAVLAAAYGTEDS